jgi:hypothetical protein
MSQPPLVEHLGIADDRRGGTMTPRRAISRLEVCLRSHSMSGDGRVRALCNAGTVVLLLSVQHSSTSQFSSGLSTPRSLLCQQAPHSRGHESTTSQCKEAKMRGEASLAPHPTPTPSDRGCDGPTNGSVGKNPDLGSFLQVSKFEPVKWRFAGAILFFGVCAGSFAPTGPAPPNLHEVMRFQVPSSTWRCVHICISMELRTSRWNTNQSVL